MAHVTLQAGDLTAVIGDNEAYEGQRQGYNGVHRLTHRTQEESLFVPTVSGLNLEHIFDGDQDLRDVTRDRKVFFEPRNNPMTLKELSKTEAELHQPPTPTFHVESWTKFSLVAPHYLDFHFRCQATQHVFKHGYMGLFWASYIYGPDDRSMYFRDQRQWQQLCTQRHNLHSTVLPRGNSVELKFTENLGDSLYQNFSPLRFDEPFFYGRFRDHVMILMFDPKLVAAEGTHLRLTHSPSGGGANAARQSSNPAWDFQLIVPKYDVLIDYTLRARLVYRPACDREEILREVGEWVKRL